MILSWGQDDALHHMVIDGGRSGTYPALFDRLESMAQRCETLDLYVLTHIDGDHIGGALTYLRDRRRPIAPACVWFNGYRQIKGAERRSVKQGEEYSQLLKQLQWPLNTHFERGVVSVETAPAEIDIAGLKIRLLSPNATRLKALADIWDDWYQDQPTESPPDTAGRRAPRRTKPPMPDPLRVEKLIVDSSFDTEPPNGSSIAFIAEWQGVRVLLTGDAHPDLLADALLPLAQAEGGRFRVDLMKASHHGSIKNTSRELIGGLDCRHFAVSTNGAIHGHPDPQAIARFLHFGVSGPKTLYFNYATARTLPWGAPEPQQTYGYRACYPHSSTPGMIEIDLLAIANDTAKGAEF